MSVPSILAAIFFSILTFGDPLLIGWIWHKRLNWPDDLPTTRWRSISLWFGLFACTVAVAAFWLGLFTNPHTYPLEDTHFRRFFRFDAVAATLGIVAALAGQGKGRWLVVLSGIGVGASWIWFAAMV